jgi:hypothetical protein
MFRSGISFVRIESVLRENLVPLIQTGVALHLRQNGRCRDALRKRVTVYQRALRLRNIDADGVDQQKVGCGLKPIDGAAHGEARSLQDVQVIDLIDICRGYGPGEGALADALRQSRPAFGGQNFAVPQAADRPVGRKDHGARKNGAEE